MTISKLQAVLLVVFLLALGIFLGRLSITTATGSADAPIASSDSIALPEEEKQTATDNAVKEAERAVQALEQDFEESMDDLYSPTPPANYRPDPELRRGQRQAVELNEMICKQTGQNCEVAAMARRHYEENYGPM